MENYEYIIKLSWLNQFLAIKSVYLGTSGTDIKKYAINFHFSWYKGLKIRGSVVDSGTSKLISKLSRGSDQLQQLNINNYAGMHTHVKLIILKHTHARMNFFSCSVIHATF